MAFVTCSQFKTSQEEQDKALEKAEKSAIKAESTLLDCTDRAAELIKPNEYADGSKGGVITVEKIKQAIAGNVEVSVKEKSGIAGSGTKENPLALSLGEGLYLDSNGVIQLQTNKPTINVIDNGTGKIVHKQAVIDYGTIVEVSGTVLLPLVQPEPNKTYSLGEFISEDIYTPQVTEFIKQIPQYQYDGARKADPVALGLTHQGDHEDFFYQEAQYNLDVTQFGIASVISANATAGDILGFRKETAWIVNAIEGSKTIPIGLHIYHTRSQTDVAVSYSIKGIKA